MKIAGRKNDGAWFRFNKFLSELDGPGKLNFRDRLLESPYIAAAHAALISMGVELGVDTANITDVDSWADQLSTYGVPRQIWYGRLSFTTYTKLTTGPNAGKTVANYQSQFHYFGKDVRRIAKILVFGTRQVRDLGNFGSLTDLNPGGLPNADAES